VSKLNLLILNTVKMKKENKSIDYSALKEKTLEQLRSGKSLFGKDGALAPLLKDIIETALESEMDSFMDFDERSEGNRRNGYNRKLLKTSDGTIPIVTPRDRNRVNLSLN
jgi:putative transposase